MSKNIFYELGSLKFNNNMILSLKFIIFQEELK